MKKQPSIWSFVLSFGDQGGMATKYNDGILGMGSGSRAGCSGAWGWPRGLQIRQCSPSSRHCRLPRVRQALQMRRKSTSRRRLAYRGALPSGGRRRERDHRFAAKLLYYR
ncbi:hypothetical protein FIBSPDRAFT_108012 [Athelia psychrophila]|uniref:Uncharacterized protein n=1 Tax=Athelia psychrophila TaxID=1759441 RepID=A0A166D7E5_9AGAM|nr:hypothetical protein FIBSPDRAFT_108012 [Fibularhizoctonia sp. CBS 109695]